MNRIRSGIAAGIVVSKRSILYTAVNHSNGRSLDRLGSCDFDFDLLAALNAGISPTQQASLTEAVNDILGDTGATSTSVGIHPALGHTFFSLTTESQSDDAREQQFREEGQLLFDDTGEFHAASSSLHHLIGEGAEDRTDLHMVTLVPSPIKNALDSITSSLSGGQAHYLTCAEGVQHLVHPAEAAPGRQSAFSLLIGQYQDQVVMSMAHRGTIVHGHTVTPATSQDYLYWAIVLATRLDISPASIRRIYYYGERADAELLEDLRLTTHAELVRVDPFALSDVDVGHIRPDFDSAAYAACIGIVI